MTVGRFVGTVTVIAAFYGSAAAMGVDLPRWAWKHELTVVEGKAVALEVFVIQEALSSTQIQLYRNLDRQDELRAKGQEIPPSLRREQSDLELKRDRFRSKLEKLEGLLGE